MAQLHLIGTLAHDPDGPQRLTDLLDEVQPDVVVVEVSRSAFERQVKDGDEASVAAMEAIAARGADPLTIAFWRRWVAKEQLYFETFSAARYADQRTRRLHFLEPDAGASPDSAPPDEGDGSADAAAYALADLETLRGIATHDWRGDYAHNYARARIDLEAKACLEFLLPATRHAAYATRTRAMAGQIEPLLRDPPAQRVAVVCALTQLYFSEAFLTLYAQLYELVTRRYLADGTGLIPDHPIVLPWKSAGSRKEA